jgi:RNA 2',3'-cyclic 3'-phosphodiesterase
VAVWPPPDVVDALAGLDRPDLPAVRWTSPEAWHVTLRFLGGVAPDDVPGVAGALGALRSPRPAVAELGPATRRLGRSVLVVPVAGLDGVAAAVDEGLAGAGVAPDERPFRGHLTVARARGRAPLPRGVAGAPLAGRWAVDEVTLVESHLGGARGSRYEVLERFRLERTGEP